MKHSNILPSYLTLEAFKENKFNLINEILIQREASAIVIQQQWKSKKQ